MPTINQLTRKPRTKKVRKSKSPVLLVGKNSIQRSEEHTSESSHTDSSRMPSSA